MGNKVTATAKLGEISANTVATFSSTESPGCGTRPPLSLYHAPEPKTMWKSRGYTHLVPCVTVVILAAVAACSSSTSPTSSTGGKTPPSGATQGDTLDLTGTYKLASYTNDSADGGTSTYTVDASDGGTLVLGSSPFTLTWTGTFAANSSGETGTYVAIDTSSSVDRGTLALTSTSGNQSGTYQYSSNTFTITLPQNSGGADVTVWTKQ
jgi:hypothetical protein